MDDREEYKDLLKGDDKKYNKEKGKSQEEFNKFKAKYQVSWWTEILITAVFLFSLAMLCGAIFGITFFTEKITRTTGANSRYFNILKESVSAETCESNLREITKVPHLSGTPEGAKMANTVAEKFRKLLDVERFKNFVSVHSETYEVLLPFPKGGNVLEIVDKENPQKKFTATLSEKPVEGDGFDKPSYPNWDASYIAYSGKGNFSGAAYYYANYGTDDDFEQLQKAGINLEAAVVIIRYGKIFRGTKVRNAEKFKVKGVILFSDPADDGKEHGEVYPDGKWRPLTAIQRGSSMFLSKSPGDPTTPGFPSYPGTLFRKSRSKAKNLPKIPVIAISGRDAAEFLRNLGGDDVPEEWKGKLEGVTYRFGSTVNNAATVTMIIDTEERLEKIHNVFATIRGNIEPDRLVMLGNHRDAWIYGATDPHSGTIAQLEIIKAFGQMLINGYRPRRTLVFASWDGEEQGLIGSTEYVEQYKAQLATQMVAYVNLDTVDGKSFSPSASPSLAKLIREVASGEESLIKKEEDKSQSVLEEWKGESEQDPVPSYIGSGSDYTAFFHHVGVSVIDLSFRIKDKPLYGAYHSIHDNFNYYKNKIDSGFKICTSVSKFAGNIILRLVDDIFLPFDLKEQATVIKSHYDKLKESKLWDGFYIGRPEDIVKKIKESIEILGRSIGEMEERADELLKKGQKLRRLTDQSLNYLTRVRSFNDRNMAAERGFTSPSPGLYNRPWYKHVVSAPGLRTGYAPEVFPAIYDALRENSTENVLNSLISLTQGIDSSTAIFSGEFSFRNTDEVKK